MAQHSSTFIDESKPSIHFTPDRGFDIEKGAEHLVRLMQRRHAPMVIELEHGAVAFEAGCSAQDIIDGYYAGLNAFSVPFEQAEERPRGAVRGL